MGAFGQGSTKELQKLKEAHRRYLETYRIINRGSLAGATSFSDFYIYRTFITKYGDPRACAPVGYR